MESFGVTIARLIAEVVVLTEATLSKFVNVTTTGGNISSVALSPLGESFAQNFSVLLNTLAWSLNDMISALWSIG